MPENKLISDKAFIEQKEKIRIIAQQRIGIEKILDLIRGKYMVEVFRNNGNIIILVEEKEVE